MEITYYNTEGKECEENAPNIVASKDSVAYYIKFARGKGPYNPIEHKISQYGLGSKKAGMEVWAYRKVNQKAFELYVHFLETRNLLFYRNAMKEIRS